MSRVEGWKGVDAGEGGGEASLENNLTRRMKVVAFSRVDNRKRGPG